MGNRQVFDLVLSDEKWGCVSRLYFWGLLRGIFWLSWGKPTYITSLPTDIVPHAIGIGICIFRMGIVRMGSNEVAHPCTLVDANSRFLHDCDITLVIPSN